MELTKLKILIENELYLLVLANSEDELTKVNINSVRNAISQFMQRYGNELTEQNIDFLTEYIWTVINKANSRAGLEKEK